MIWLQWVSVPLNVPAGLPLIPEIEGALAVYGEPLRWAITQAVTADGVRRLTVEAVVVPRTLTV